MQLEATAFSYWGLGMRDRLCTTQVPRALLCTSMAWR